MNPQIGLDNNDLNNFVHVIEAALMAKQEIFLKETLTTNQGAAVPDDQNSLTISNNGPVIFQDVRTFD